MLPGSFEARPAAKIGSRRSEERRRGREGVRPKARARSAGGERAEEASDHSFKGPGSHRALFFCPTSAETM
jgi:hypothetical protein